MVYKRIFMYITFLITFNVCYANTYNLEADLEFLNVSATNVNGKNINEKLFYEDHILCYGNVENIKNQEAMYVDGKIIYKYLPEDYDGNIVINPKYMYYTQEIYDVENAVFQMNLQNYLSWLNNSNYSVSHNNRIKYLELLYNENKVYVYGMPLTPIRCGLKNIKLVSNPSVLKHGYTSAYIASKGKTVYFKLPKIDENFEIKCNVNLEEKEKIYTLKVESSVESILETQEIDKYEIIIYKNNEVIYDETRKNIKAFDIEKQIDSAEAKDVFTSIIRVSTVYKNDGVFSKQVEIQPPRDNLVKEINDVKIGRLSSKDNKYYFENRNIIDKNIFQAGEYMIIRLDTNSEFNFINSIYKRIENSYYIVNKLPIDQKSTLQNIYDLRMQSDSYFNINYENYLSRLDNEYIYEIEYYDENNSIKKIEIKYDILGNIFSNLNYTFKFTNDEKYEI